MIWLKQKGGGVRSRGFESPNVFCMLRPVEIWGGFSVFGNIKTLKMCHPYPNPQGSGKNWLFLGKGIWLV